MFSERNPEKNSGAFERLVLRVRDGHLCSVRGQTLSDCRANATRAARNERDFSFQFPPSFFSPIPLISFLTDPVAYVGRAVEKRDASCFTSPEEANNLHID